MTIHSGDVIRVSPTWNWSGGPELVNVLALLVGPGLAATEPEVRLDIDQYLETLYGIITTRISNQIAHQGTGIFNYSLDTPEIGIGANAALNGSGGGEVLPLMMCPFVWMRTSVSRVIGKKFLPAFTESSWEGDRWNSGTRTALQDFADQIRASFAGDNGTDLKCVVWRRAQHDYENLLDASYAPYPRTQRRRRPGVGV